MNVNMTLRATAAVRRMITTTTFQWSKHSFYRLLFTVQSATDSLGYCAVCSRQPQLLCSLLPTASGTPKPQQHIQQTKPTHTYWETPWDFFSAPLAVTCCKASRNVRTHPIKTNHKNGQYSRKWVDRSSIKNWGPPWSNRLGNSVPCPIRHILSSKDKRHYPIFARQPMISSTKPNNRHGNVQELGPKCIIKGMYMSTEGQTKTPWT